MSDKSDQKLREVAVARFGYRHEAEFAAGFLEDAGVPYRLQIDDPAMGLAVSSSATLWVAAMDERRARGVLEDARAEPLDEDAAAWELVGEEEPGAEDPPRHPGRGASGDAGVVRRPPPAARAETASAVDRLGHKQKPDLTLRQRVLSVAGSVVVGSTLTVDALREAPAILSLAVAVVAVGLALAGILGRAPGFLQRILAFLSGDL